MAPPFPKLTKAIKAVYPVPPEDLPGLGDDHRFETMAVWNRKGGVAKTTMCHALGFAYALKGKRVLMVDSDAQCDLSCLLLREWVKHEQTHEATANGIVDYSLFFNHQVPGRAMKNNLRAALQPVIQFAGDTDPLGAWAPADVTKIELPADCKGALFLLPGHQDISTYEEKITLAYSSNLSLEPGAPGAWNKLMALTARKCGAEIILVDCNPYVGTLNMHIVLTSNYLFLPCMPDFHSHNAIKALPAIMRDWANTRNSARETLVNSKQLPPDLKIPGGNPRILGASIMKFTKYKGRAATSFQHWIELINTAMSKGSEEIRESPALVGMAGNPEAPETWPSILVEVPDFTSLGAISNFYGIPVFTVGRHMTSPHEENPSNNGKVTRKEGDKVNKAVMKFQRLFKTFLEEISSKVGSESLRVSFGDGGTDDEDITDSGPALQPPGQENQEGDTDPHAAP